MDGKSELSSVLKGLQQEAESQNSKRLKLQIRQPKIKILVLQKERKNNLLQLCQLLESLIGLLGLRHIAQHLNSTSQLRSDQLTHELH